MSPRKQKRAWVGAVIAGGWLLCLFGVSLGDEQIFEMTPNGAWSWCSDPRCFVRGSTVYAGWVTTEGDVQIGSLDLSSGHGTVVDLAPLYEPDDHDNPVFVETDDGRWTAFYSKHAGYEGTHYRVTVDPQAVGRWHDQTAVGTNTPGIGGATYAHAFAAPGETDRIFLFWRGGDWKPNYSIGTYDSGAATWTWTDAQTLIMNPGQRPYAKYWTDGVTRIGIAFTDGHPGQTENNVYYAAVGRGDDGGFAFFRADGTRIGALSDGPLWPALADTVFDRTADPAVTGGNSWVWDVGFDGEDHPVVAFATFPSREQHQYHWARFDGGRWDDVILVEDAGGSVADTTIGSHHQVYYSGGMALDHRDPTTVYLCRGNDAGGWDLEQWARTEQGDWLIRAITPGAEEKNMRPMVPEGAPPFVDIVAWMSGVYEYWENLGGLAWWPINGSGANYQTGIELWVSTHSTGTGEADAAVGTPVLLPNHPNPFREGTVLSYALPEPRGVTVRIVDVAGRLVRTLVHREARGEGIHQALWDGRDECNQRVAAGVYFCRLEAGHEGASRKLVLLE